MAKIIAKTIEDLKTDLEVDRDFYRSVIESNGDKTVRGVCYGKLDVIHKVLDFLNDNNLVQK